MIESANALSETKLALWSSTADGTWGDRRSSERHVRWHFDALSDDGREAILVVFVSDVQCGPDIQQDDADRTVLFAYFVDGKAVCRTSHTLASEVDIGNVFRLSGTDGEPNFIHTTAPYGSGYSVEVDLKLNDGRHLKASLEWLSVESDLLSDEPDVPAGDLKWNIAAPRADVSGRIVITEKSGKTKNVRHFRGTGFHDQRTSSHDIIAGSREWLWCRGHFTDLTAIFFRYWSREADKPANKLVLIRDGQMCSYPAEFVFSEERLLGRGRTPIAIHAGDGIEMRVAPLKTIRCGEAFKRYIADITIKAEDGLHRSNGFLETLSVPIWQSRLGTLWKKAKLPWQ